MDGLFGCVVFEIHGSRWSFQQNWWTIKWNVWKICGLLGVVMHYVGLLCELLWKIVDLQVFFKEIGVLLGEMHGKFVNC